MGARDRLRALAWGALYAALIGALAGCASALFLFLLERATVAREARPWLVYLLPVAGLVLGWLYERFGAPIRGGTNLVIDTIHDGGSQVPRRMAPLVLLGTVLTHVFGGSAGREGTAVQMGAGLADGVAHAAKVPAAMRRVLLLSGVAGGFGSVFGTPIAGAVFALEFSTVGRLEYDALVPALVAALVGDLTTRALRIGHTHYPQLAHTALTPALAAKWALFAVGVALVSTAFIELRHLLESRGRRYVRSLALRMALGGGLVVLMAKALGTNAYLGLGVPGIVRAFEGPAVHPSAFALKLLFTAVTLSAGFLGGEVTPLFFVGASLGAAYAQLAQVPIALGAGVGMAAVFATASNAPLALSIMAVELLGAEVLPHVALVCALAFVLGGHRSIYAAQRFVRSKSGEALAAPTSLRAVRERVEATRASGRDSRVPPSPRA